MITGVLTTSFPRHRGDFAGCFVEDAVWARVARGETVEVIAAGDGDAAEAGENVTARSASEDSGAIGQRQRQPLPAIRATSVRVWRVPMPATTQHTRLFYGSGAPETLESCGPIAWLQALGFWAGLCARTRERSSSWDQIVAHWLVPCGLAARVVAPDLPLTMHAHSGDVALLERIPLGAELGRWLGRAPCDLIFASANLRERFARLTGLSVGRVAPAASVFAGGPTTPRPDARGRETARRELNLHRRTVLAIGRLVPIKGFDVLLRADARAVAHDKTGGLRSTTIVILGDGPERTHLQTLARRLDVDLRLPGFVPRDDVNRWMAGADIYVQSSRQLPGGRTEGLPVAAIEALRAGLPVIASATGGLCELPGLAFDAGLAPQLVRLVPAENPDALATCLRESLPVARWSAGA